jgi:hypothetical protein
METPFMVKSLGQKDPFDISSKVAQGREQVISNQQAYDIQYPNAQAFYDQRRFTVIDRNFRDVEDSLLNGLKQTIDSVLDTEANKKLTRADDMKRPDLGGLDLQNKAAPFVHPAVVDTQMHYDPPSFGTRYITSDPYKANYGH